MLPVQVRLQELNPTTLTCRWGKKSKIQQPASLQLVGLNCSAQWHQQNIRCTEELRHEQRISKTSNFSVQCRWSAPQSLTGSSKAFKASFKVMPLSSCTIETSCTSWSAVGFKHCHQHSLSHRNFMGARKSSNNPVFSVESSFNHDIIFWHLSAFISNGLLPSKACSRLSTLRVSSPVSMAYLMAFYLAYLLAFYLAYLLAYLLTSYLAFYLIAIPALYLGVCRSVCGRHDFIWFF